MKNRHVQYMGTTAKDSNIVNETVMLSMRFPKPMRDRIIKDIEETGDFSTITQWIQTAAREYLKIRETERANRKI